MKLNILLVFLLSIQLLQSQTFTEFTENPFEGMYLYSMTCSDVDGDGNKDFLVTGTDSLADPIVKLYTYSGGNLSEMELAGNPFENLQIFSTAFSDVDGDGDNDLVILGKAMLELDSYYVTRLYTNNGGNFSQALGTPFEQVRAGSIAFSDIDGDGDEDLMVTGGNNSFEKIAKLYTNDGGSFSEVTGTPFEGVWKSDIAFSDVDGDGDEDLMISGENNSFEKIAKLYTNDGGNFLEVPGTPFVGVIFGSITFFDLDGDEDNDLFYNKRLYTNDNDNFSEVELTDSPFECLAGGFAFSDVDGDGDKDLMISVVKLDDILGQITIDLYTNNNGSFSKVEMPESSFESIFNSSLAFWDIDGDGDEDLIITGNNIFSEQPITKIYTNDRLMSSIEDFNHTTHLDFSLYPNPAKAENINISYSSIENGFVEIELYNLNGQLLNHYKELATIGKQTFLIGIASLDQGSYFIQLNDGKRKDIV